MTCSALEESGHNSSPIFRDLDSRRSKWRAEVVTAPEG
jgi:hypothetical protein